MKNSWYCSLTISLLSLKIKPDDAITHLLEFRLQKSDRIYWSFASRRATECNQVKGQGGLVLFLLLEEAYADDKNIFDMENKQ